MIHALLAAVAAAGGGGGGGVPLDPELTRTRAGLIFSDDFVRADSSVLGNGWTEVSGDWEVNANRLRGPSDNTATTRSVDKDLGVGLAAILMQVNFWSRNSADTADSAVHMGGLAVHPVAGINGYWTRISKLNNNLTFYRSTADVRTLLATDTSGGGAGEAAIQLYAESSVQEVRSGATMQGSISQTDATHAFAGTPDTRIRLFATHPAGGNPAARPVFRDLLVMQDRNVVVSGLSAGYKVRVLNTTPATVLEVTETAGVATLDMLRGSVAEYVPFAGWAKIQVLSGSNVLLAEIVGSVYPGDTYTYTE